MLALGGLHLAVAAPPPSPAAVEVKIDNFSFAPAALVVQAGTKVTWVNHDDIPHTVVSTDNDKTFKSKVLDTDEKFTYVFAKPGRYPYFCSVHPKMTGEVVVK
ncbi:MAG TPA: cupredoxin family copper-binding protein [Thermoanaerobaculia bacterium]|nr:cupredoxin family copper-binding protein [Thermoanaerobaculia bacterium]